MGGNQSNAKLKQRPFTLCSIPGIGPVTAQHLSNRGYYRPCELWAAYESRDYNDTFIEWLNGVSRNIQMFHVNNCISFLASASDIIEDSEVTKLMANIILKDPEIYYRPEYLGPVYLILQEFSGETVDIDNIYDHTITYVTNVMREHLKRLRKMQRDNNFF